MIIGCVTALIATASSVAVAGGERVYLHPEEFIRQVFPDNPPARALWVQAPLRKELSEQFGWEPGLRVRYWQQGARTAWILDEIGKDKPITAGVVVDNGEIEDVQVLVFRESRGWEIRFPNFTRQFVSARLGRDETLTRNIDGITGATLSVKAMKRMARVALKLHAQTPARTLAQAG